MATGCSTVLEHAPHHHNVVGLRLAATVVTWRDILLKLGGKRSTHRHTDTQTHTHTHTHIGTLRHNNLLKMILIETELNKKPQDDETWLPAAAQC